VTAQEIGRVTIAEALELTGLVARKQPERYGRFAARWLCLYLEEHEKAMLEDVTLLVSNLRSLATQKDHARALAILRTAADNHAPARSPHPLAADARARVAGDLRPSVARTIAQRHLGRVR
jgi:hypothetical protein